MSASTGHRRGFAVLTMAVFFVVGLSASPMMNASQTSPSLSTPAPNELGGVMVLMYHDIGPRESTWRRTPENFKQDLIELHNRGYAPIALTDLVEGRIDTPRGKTPVVLTFDDGHPGQFQWKHDAQDQTPADDSAIGILKSFHEEHPDFPLEATFFLNGHHPFGQKDQVQGKLNYLLANGMDIGNHSTRHRNLGSRQYQNPEVIQSAIGNQARFLSRQVMTRFPDYTINTFALCYGRRPNVRLQPFLKSGSVDSFRYRNIAVLNVGAGPTKSPFDNRFKPLAIPRIRASRMNTCGTGLYDWLARFDAVPKDRFISDGDPSKVTIPSDQTNWLNSTFVAQKGYLLEKIDI
jgi:peptidoglycan/xylan/chitin deacetylase (PgdA/CDA1 family)